MIELLKGQMKLWKVFWIVYIPYLALNAAAISIIKTVGNTPEILLTFWIYFFCGLAGYIILLVSIWRCSNNTDWVAWTNLTKFYVVKSLLDILVLFPAFIFEISTAEFIHKYVYPYVYLPISTVFTVAVIITTGYFLWNRPNSKAEKQ